MEFEFESEAIWWKGPAPFVFVPTPPDVSAEIREVAPRLTYGWGVLPATVRIGKTEYTTALFPKDGGYLVPVKVKVQRAEGVEVGDPVRLHLALGRETDVSR